MGSATNHAVVVRRQTVVASTFAHRPLHLRLERRFGSRWLHRADMVLPLEADALIEAATDATGLTDLGDPMFEEGFRRLARAFADEAGLSPVGTAMIANTLFIRLTNRLQIERTLAETPEIRDEVIDRPIFIIGMPRTASTYLQRLIAADPVLHHLRFADALYPAPPPAVSPERESERLARATDHCDAVDRYGPDLDRLHHVTPEAPEECYYLLQNSFVHRSFGISGPVPSYQAWVTEQSARPIYADYRDQLKILQHGKPQQRWILKCISHWTALPELFEVFPDAHFIQTHRHPGDVIPSFVNLMASARAVCSDDLIDPQVHARQLLDSLPGLLEGVHRFRLGVPYEQQFDVLFDDVVRDPDRTLAAVYEKFELAPPGDPLRRTSHAVEEGRARRRASNRYTVESFGLHDDEVTSAFAAYLDRYLP